MTFLKIALFIPVMLCFLECSNSDKQTDRNIGNLGDVSAVKLDGRPVTVAGVTFRPPSAWKDLGPGGMRQANYTLGPLEGEKDSATMAVFYFGATQGGSVNENIERWISQISLPDGGDSHKAVVQNDFNVDGMPVHLVELAGTYQASARGMMGGATESKENYRMAAVVLETPEGNLFFKLTGPDYTARTMIGQFRAMLKEIKRAPKLG
ncbi:MAG: hypothetical protein NT002_06135 [candidate division Zixibacteria bacterium]|nr:hypothetical protein [candidate division Zixibacteria bacterium]